MFTQIGRDIVFSAEVYLEHYLKSLQLPSLPQWGKVLSMRGG
jgi:hypothetical protein